MVQHHLISKQVHFPPPQRMNHRPQSNCFLEYMHHIVSSKSTALTPTLPLLCSSCACFTMFWFINIRFLSHVWKINKTHCVYVMIVNDVFRACSYSPISIHLVFCLPFLRLYVCTARIFFECAFVAVVHATSNDLGPLLFCITIVVVAYVPAFSGNA